MPILVDTNILLRSLHPAHPHYSPSENAVQPSPPRGDALCCATEPNRILGMATRPREENGLGMSHAEARIELATLRRLFRILPAPPEVFEAWQRIVFSQQIVGKQTHDAHLVAIMHIHGVTSILTFNVSHFQRFYGITVLNPLEF